LARAVRGRIVSAADSQLALAASLNGGSEAAGDVPASVGVDLGTATTVLVALAADGRPIWVGQRESRAIRDGVVVDFIAASSAVEALRLEAETALGHRLGAAGVAYPPQTSEGVKDTCCYVVERAGLDCAVAVDEVSAANRLLNLAEGAIVDVGGGSTGVGILSQSRLVDVGDLPGGGHHLDLILAGALGIDTVEAERRKRLGDMPGLLAILRPGIERIADRVMTILGDRRPPLLELVGGGLKLAGAPSIVEKLTGIPVRMREHSELVTPLGIALSMDEA
jgi:ethanolamine utilization protein EutJ